MTKNKLSDLNNHLFAQLERLADEDLSPEGIDKEHQRAEAMVSVADQILRMSSVQLQAAKMVYDYDGSDPRPYLSAIRDEPSLNGQALTVLPSRK
jgi:hypothetical protein